MESMSYRENPKPPTSYKVGRVGQLFVGVVSQVGGAGGVGGCQVLWGGGGQV